MIIIRIVGEDRRAGRGRTSSVGAWRLCERDEQQHQAPARVRRVYAAAAAPSDLDPVRRLHLQNAGTEACQGLTRPGTEFPSPPPRVKPGAQIWPVARGRDGGKPPRTREDSFKGQGKDKPLNPRALHSVCKRMQ
jgi:hypothetical protein